MPKTCYSILCELRLLSAWATRVAQRSCLVATRIYGYTISCQINIYIHISYIQMYFCSYPQNPCCYEVYHFRHTFVTPKSKPPFEVHLSHTYIHIQYMLILQTASKKIQPFCSPPGPVHFPRDSWLSVELEMESVEKTNECPLEGKP